MLLSGLRTGGVRASAGPTMPQTAAINGSFQAPRFASHHQQQALFEENIDDMNSYANLSYGMPMTAALDGRAPRFQQQQQLQFLQHQARLAVLNGNNNMNGMMNPIDPAQAQLMQLQLMQAMVSASLNIISIENSHIVPIRSPNNSKPRPFRLNWQCNSKSRWRYNDKRQTV
jgi:hypothetical protein